MTSKDDELRAVTAQVNDLVDELRGTVAALQAILTGPAPGDQPPVEVTTP